MPILRFLRQTLQVSVSLTVGLALAVSCLLSIAHAEVTEQAAAVTEPSVTVTGRGDAAAEPKVTVTESQTTAGGTAQSGSSTAQSGSSTVQPSLHTANKGSHLTVGLALGGGGTRGAAHIGVLRVLEQEGIPIDYIAGTSMGAIVGGLYDAKVPLSVCERRAADGSIMSHFMTLPLSVRIATSPLSLLPRLFGYHPYDGLYRGNRFRKYLVKLIAGGDCKIEDLPIPFCATALSLRDGKIHALNSGSLAYALQATSALPALRKPVQICDDLYIDGGVAANVPVQQAREMGADIVIAVNVDESFTEVPLRSFRQVGSVTQRLVNWQLWYHDKPLCNKADIVIHPNVDGIGLLSRKHKDAKYCVAAGEQAARSAIPAIKARLAVLSVSQNTASEAVAAKQ